VQDDADQQHHTSSPKDEKLWHHWLAHHAQKMTILIDVRHIDGVFRSFELHLISACVSFQVARDVPGQKSEQN